MIWLWHDPVAAVVAAALAVPPVSAAQQQAMYDAVRQMLEKAGVQKQDLPRQILSVEPAGANRYKVHMQMVQGEGWFALTWTGHGWEATGLNE